MPDIDQAAEVANALAPEHLELCVSKPKTLLKKIKNAGAIFLGGMSTEAFGDYVAGPSHVLPTGGAARFSSPLSVYDFLLFKIYKENKRLLLIIDEAQRLNHELLEEIRHLSNIETQNTKLLTIILAGQNELNSILRQDINRAIRQRISLNYYLKPLSKNDTREYIRHRLNIAGTEKKIFKSDTLPAVMSFSKGYPRLINSICDQALLTGYVKGVRQIDARIIRECAEELRLPTEEVRVPSKISK